MSKIETQLEINGVTYSGKDLSLICLGMSLKEESIIKLLEDNRYLCSTEKACWENLDSGCECPELIALIKGEK